MNIFWNLLIVGVVLITAVLFAMCKIEQRKWYRDRESELRDWNDEETGWPSLCHHEWDVSTGGAHPAGTIICVYCGIHKTDK